MSKVTVTLRCPDHPSVEKVFEGEKVYDLEIEHWDDTDDILNKMEPHVFALRGDSYKTIMLTAVNEGGSTILRGTINKGFSGIRML